MELECSDSLPSALQNFAELLTLLIEAYEEKHYAISDASPVEILREWISANNLRQKDLAPLLGSESIVSEILGGKRTQQTPDRKAQHRVQSVSGCFLLF
jgi:HTH-type transcriptional regulator / antitoxin HigA